MASHQEHHEPRDRGSQRSAGRNDRSESPRKQDSDTGNWGTSDSDGQLEDEQGRQSRDGNGSESRRESSSVDSIDDEDSGFDGYDSEAPNAGRKH